MCQLFLERRRSTQVIKKEIETSKSNGNSTVKTGESYSAIISSVIIYLERGLIWRHDFLPMSADTVS